MAEILPVRPRKGSRQSRSARRSSRAMGVLHGPCRTLRQKKLASTAKVSRVGDRACRRGGSPQSEHLRPLQRGQVQGLWRAARPLLIEETSLRAQPERVQFPTLCVLTTSAAFHHAEFLPPSVALGKTQSSETCPTLARRPGQDTEKAGIAERKVHVGVALG